jgi:hypothetical protein
VVKACVQRGAWFEDAGKHSPTRIEFDKALVNLASNLLGLLRAIDTNGRFRRLKVAEIATGENRAAIDRLAREVFRVGQAVRAYNARDQVDDLIAGLHRTLQLHAGHVPSSIQWVDVALRRGHLQPALTPTEKWLLEPLVRYAEAAGLEQTAAYFRSLEAELIESLGRAIRRSGEE